MISLGLSMTGVASTRRIFTPLSLFRNGEQGAWYDPSDLSTLFQDSAGTTPVTSDGDPVGLMLDKSRGLVLGEELVINPVDLQAEDWSLGDGWSVVDGQLIRESGESSGSAAQQLGVLSEVDTTGKTYQFTIDIAAQSGSFLLAINSPGINSVTLPSGAGVKKILLTVTGNRSNIQITAVSSATITINSISARELPGNHASQSVSASRPVYRTDGVLHWLEFDGADDFLSIPNETDGAIGSDNTAVFGLRPFDGSLNPYVLGGNNDSGFEMLFYNATEIIRPAVVTTSGAIADTGTTAYTDSNLIYAADWARSLGRLRGWANQILEVTALGPIADKKESATYAIGARGADGSYLVGRIYGGLITDALLDDTNRQALENYLAKKSGVTL